MITGRVYLDHGRPVTVLAQWTGTGHPAGRPGTAAGVIWYPPRGNGKYRQAPRNVLIRPRRDGATVVRPFRGLRTAGSA